MQTRFFSALLSYAFRPFFLFNGLFAMLVIAIWLLVLQGVGVAFLPAYDALWHAHEMLFGFAMAAIAGFVLTAVAAWTGRPPVCGWPLGWLLFAWLAGRLAMAVAGPEDSILLASIDMLLPLGLTLVAGREIVIAGSRRNYPVIAVLSVLSLLNLSYHIGRLLGEPDKAQLALFGAMHLILLLVTLIGGRIIPSFTANWLRQSGVTTLPTSSRAVESLVFASTLLTGIAASLNPLHPATAALAAIAAISHALRLSRWRGLSTVGEPLVFVLHAAYFWLPVGYAALSMHSLGLPIPLASALHALALGGIGSMILAVSTRVALGHTGRPLKAARLTVLAYALLMIAALLRVLGPISGAAYLWVLDISAIAWIGSFGLFTWVYWPILTGARADA